MENESGLEHTLCINLFEECMNILIESGCPSELAAKAANEFASSGNNICYFGNPLPNEYFIQSAFSYLIEDE